MHGEHRRWPPLSTERSGSSPYARGARFGAVPVPAGGGIIPVCTGSTAIQRACNNQSRDHPRMHGEHIVSSPPKPMPPGSSPYARGALRPTGVRQSAAGIIPVCTGSTRRSMKRCSSHRDHPRMHGEHAYPSSRLFPGEGSSPYARGARLQCEREGLCLGIIPVCTGST